MKLRIAWRLPVQLYNTLVALGTTSIVLMPCAYPLYDGKNDDAKYDNKHDGDDETQYIKHLHCKHLRPSFSCSAEFSLSIYLHSTIQDAKKQKEKGYPISTLLDNLFENHFFPSLRSGRVVSIPSGIT